MVVIMALSETLKSVYKLEGQKDIFRVLVEIEAHGEVFAEQLKRSGFNPQTYYRVLDKLKDFGLIKSRLDDSAEGAFRRMYSLTPYGEELLAHLKEIEKILVASQKEADRKKV